jgi:hypothetical protein
MSTEVDLTTQVMMTLSGVAGFGATERPSGETVEVQEKRIFKGIETQLADSTLATGGIWQIVWLGMTRDRANLAYIAQTVTAVGVNPYYAVVFRGTAFSMSIDVAEDMKVSVLLPFEAAGPNGKISQGSMRAFTEIMSAVCHPTVTPVPQLQGTSMVKALQLLVAAALAPPTLYVTGHSLGGAMATTLGLYFAKVPWGRPLAGIRAYTFAAPTAGDAGFASAFDAAFPTAVCVWNKYDAVPNAWWNLVNGNTGVDHFYPTPGPAANLEVKELVKKINATAAPGYTQPKAQAPLNSNYGVYDSGHVSSTTDDWLAQVAFQHDNNTYLGLLGAKKLSAAAPVVNSISPPSGTTKGGTTVTIRGANFTPDSTVDFGVVLAKGAVISPDGKTITVPSPPGVGIIDITVTTMYGTSTADLTKDQFAYTST